MGDPMRIRATTAGDIVDVKILMRHDMETGQRKDAAGAIIPGHFITKLTVKSNDKIVLDGNFGPSIAKDPYLAFKFKGGTKGDKISVTWTDNKGDTRTDQAVAT
jgi:sulfur-oxidizing protein SoxZ